MIPLALGGTTALPLMLWGPQALLHGINRITVSIQAPKRRKTVDRRASKGRKLRYHVHEKLVNFMTPATECRSSADGEAGVSAALCSNLFGQRQLPAPAAQLA